MDPTVRFREVNRVKKVVSAQILGAEEARPDNLTTYANGALWSAASGRFHPVQLRAAIVSRGWTVAEFAGAAGVSRAGLYNALRGWAASDRTAIRIATTLATREPLALLATIEMLGPSRRPSSSQTLSAVSR